MRRSFLPALAVLGLAACVDTSLTKPESGDSSAQRPLSPSATFSRGPLDAAIVDHVLIETKGSSSAVGAAVASLGGNVERDLSQVNVTVARHLTPAAIAALSSRPDVASVTQDVTMQWIRTAPPRTESASNVQESTRLDPTTAAWYGSAQWNMKVTRVNETWPSTPQGAGATVYVLDTGVDPYHNDLRGRVDLAKSRSFAELDPGDYFDYVFHGTFVSAIISSNGRQVASVAPQATIVAVKVLGRDGSGSFADIISGIIYAADQGADVINMSLAGYFDVNDPVARKLLFHLQAAIAYARQKGVVVVAAAGNDGFDLIHDLKPYPGNGHYYVEAPGELVGVVGVGATAPVNQRNFDQIASYSNFGWTGPFGGVQMFAPGGDLVKGGVFYDLVVSACSQYSPYGCTANDVLFGAGTSFASPMVAGEAAVLRSILGPSRAGSFRNAECLLQGTDAIGPRAIFGNGRMDAVKAVACAKGRGRRTLTD